MADDDLDSSTPDYGTIADQVLARVANYITADVIVDMLAKALIKALSGVAKGLGQAVLPIAKLGGEALAATEDPILPVFAGFVAPIVSSMFGTSADAELFTSRSNTAGRSEASAQLVDAFMAAIAGDGAGEAEPGDEGAKRIAGAGVHAALEGWFNAWILEMLGDVVPWEWLKFKEMTALPEDIIAALGVGRLVRRAIAPLVDATAATPMKWQANRTYRPNLLPEAEILSAFKRGDYNAAEAAEELARLGYTDRRQDMLLKSATKRLSVDDVQVLRRGGTLDRDYALQNLRDEGYDDTTAQYLVIAAESRRLENVRDNSLPAIVTAYKNRDLDESQFRTLIQAIVPDASEQDFTLEFARTERELNVRHMSQGEVLDALDHLILPVAFYRDWLVREGYPPDEATALELLYIAKRHEKADINAERARIAKEKADEKAARDADRERRQTELEAQRALHRRGSLNDLRRAYARGLITRDRLAEVLNAEYDADTVATLLEDADVDRANEAAREQAAADAKQRAARRQIDVGALEQAVLHHILTVQAYADALTARAFDAGDVQILASTLAAKLKDQDDAVRQRAQAAQAAAVKHIDLVRFEHLVRRGLRTVGDYDTLLRTLGFEDAARAAMEQLLSVQIADDAKAQQFRDASAAKAGVKELSLEQFRRAVILELKSETDYGNFVAKQGYTPDAAAVLVAELERDVQDADAARAKRLAAEAAKAVVDLPLSRVTAAARLGVVTPDAYTARLQRAGYSDDDIAIEMELLLVEIADTQAARAKRDALAKTTPADKALTLQQLAAAVKVGTATIDQYRAAAAAIYAPDDVDTLAATLEAEAQTHADARARHDAIAGELQARGLVLADLESQVKAGTLSIAAYKAQLGLWEYAKDDQQLLATLLV